MSNLVVSQATSLAKALSISSDAPAELVAVLKATAFKGQVSDAQMTALLVVANQYGLNPWTKEIYAFRTRTTASFPLSALMAGRGSSIATRNSMAWNTSRITMAALASFTERPQASGKGH